jgi:ubiquinone/menaquinone biosynthesis C-methylase UbiE
MTDHYEDVYKNKAVQYELMVSREDYQDNIRTSIQEIRNLTGLDVVDSGAGTGRLACMFAPFTRSMAAFDTSAAMLEVASQRLQASGLTNWRTEVADHRQLPVADASVDVILSGWSVVYTVVWNTDGTWRAELGRALAEMRRVLRPGGTMIILETMGTGSESPNPPSDLLEYFEYLKADGFSSSWFRTDYEFASMEEARELIPFFFGEEMIEKVQAHAEVDPNFEGEESVILPECTGMWWKQI